MKNFIKNTTSFLFIFLFALTSFSQETKEKYELRKERMEKVTKKMNTYIAIHFNEKLPQQEITRFNNSLKNSNHHEDENKHMMSIKDRERALNNFKINYYSNQFFVKNPTSRKAFSPVVTGPVCSNGGFESNSWLDYSGAFVYGNTDGYSSGNCGIEASDFVLTPINLSIVNVADFDIMSVGNDNNISIGTLQKVFTGMHSARINSDLNQPGEPDPNHTVSKLNKKIVLTEDYQDIYFRYALVMVDPSGHTNSKPTFKANLFDNTGVNCDNICIESNMLDTFLRFSGNYVGSGIGNPIIYQKWECGKLTSCGLAGDTVDLEFLMTDCGQGGHWGYAYIDDICDTCISDSFNTNGSINLLPTDTCAGDTMAVYGTYNLAVFDSVSSTLDSIRFYIYQNGVEVAGPFAVDSIFRDTFCVKIDPSHFPSASGGFDFYVEADFIFSATSITIVNETHSNPGPNNDYIFDPQCCPEFIIYTCCDIEGGVAGKSYRSSKRPIITPLIQSKISAYNKAVKKKYPVKSLTVDSCCMYCEFPDVPFPIFVFDSEGNAVDTYLYTLTYSHHPPPYYALDSLLPDSTTIVTVTGPGSCVWSDTFSVPCCDNLSPQGVCCDTFDLNLDVDSSCVGDPCDLGLLNYTINVNINGVILGYADYLFTWSNGSHANIISTSRGSQNIWVAVYDSAAGCTDTAFYIIDCEPKCIPVVPTNAECNFVKKNQVLTWDLIPGMTYEVELNFNDNSCCRTNGKKMTEVHPVTTNAFFGSYWSSCFSWRVRSICPDGTESAWSSKICSCDEPIIVKCYPKEPENLLCQRVGISQSLSWNAVPNVSLYEIKLIYGDGDCCNSIQQIQEFVTTTNSYYSGPFLRRCFSWRVRSICPDGRGGDWSGRKCSCIKPTINLVVGKATKIAKKLDGINVVEVKTTPNPAIDLVKFEISTTLKTKEFGELIITNLTGEVLYQSRVKLNGSSSIDLSKINSGIYFYKVVSDEEFKSGKIIITN